MGTASREGRPGYCGKQDTFPSLPTTAQCRTLLQQKFIDSKVAFAKVYTEPPSRWVSSGLVRPGRRGSQAHAHQGQAPADESDFSLW